MRKWNKWGERLKHQICIEGSDLVSHSTSHPCCLHCHFPANSPSLLYHFHYWYKSQWSISMFDKFIKNAGALSWPFQACKINAYGRAPCLRRVIQPVCEETLGEEPGELDESERYREHPPQTVVHEYQRTAVNGGRFSSFFAHYLKALEHIAIKWFHTQ